MFYTRAAWAAFPKRALPALNVRLRQVLACFTACVLTLGLAVISPEVLAKPKNKGAEAVNVSQKSERRKARLAKKRAALAAATAGGGAAVVAAKEKTRPKAAAVTDAELLGIYQAVNEGKSQQALGMTQALLKRAPNYQLLHLIEADLLLIRGRGNVKLVASLNEIQKARLSELQQEAWLRLQSQLNKLNKLDNKDTRQIPSALLQLADNEPYALVVDSKLARLYVYKNTPNQAPELVADYYTTLGKQGIYKNKEGDQRTPVGVYFVDGPVRQKLTDLYGFAALNTDYPNAWDRRLGRTGHGIWLHGTPSDTFARAPFASDGCVVLSNPDLDRVLALPNAGTMPIIVMDKIDLMPAANIATERDTLNGLLTQWRDAVLRGDAQALNALYRPDFKSDGQNKQAALAALLTSKPTGLKITNIGIFRYPSEPDMMLTQFTETRELDQSSKAKTKQLYWKKDAKGWKILLEQTL